MLNLALNIFELFLNYVWIANLFFIVVIVLMEKRNPLYTILWIFILTIFPYVGFFVYLFLGMSFTKERVANKFYKRNKIRLDRDISKSEKEELKRWKGLLTYLHSTSNNSLNMNNTIDIYNEGIDFFDSLKEEIKNAKISINMEYFIFKFDNLGKEIAQLLVEKAKQGIKINLMIDGVNRANNKLIKFFKNSGVEINFFFRTHIPLFNVRINYRDHRKITIIDSKIAFIGGMNIGDEYLGNSDMGYWRDTSIKIIGDTVIDLEREFHFILGVTKKQEIKYDKTKYEYLEFLKEELDIKEDKNLKNIQVVSSGPNYEFRTLRDNFLKLIQTANTSILIQTPYFVPDDSLLDALKTAIMSGIDVKIMIPNRADHLFIYWVNQFYVGELLKIGASVYRYEKGFLHSKVIIVDNEIVSIGTCNFDYRSLYLNFEINVNVYEKLTAVEFKNQFYRDINDSKKLDFEDFEQRSIFIRIKESILRLLSPVL